MACICVFWMQVRPCVGLAYFCEFAERLNSIETRISISISSSLSLKFEVRFVSVTLMQLYLYECVWSIFEKFPFSCVCFYQT